MGDFEGADLVAVVEDRLVRLQLDQLQPEAKPADDPLQPFEHLLQPRWAVDHQRQIAVEQVVGLQQPRQAEEVVGVEVGEVDLVDLDQPQRALHLPLRPLAAVEQQPLPATRHQDARGRAPCRRHRAAGAEEGHRQVHGGEPMRSGRLSRCQNRGRHQALKVVNRPTMELEFSRQADAPSLVVQGWLQTQPSLALCNRPDRH